MQAFLSYNYLMKALYRKKYLKLRKEVKNKDIKDNIIFGKVINNMHIKDARTVLIYVSLDDEINTFDLIKYLLNDKKVAVPKVNGSQMDFYYINSLDELEVGNYNVLEPTTNQMVKRFYKCVSITPGVCYSYDGYRIGYGKGYYDKFYQKHKSIYKIGLCYRELLFDNIPHDKFDIKVDEIISD